MILFDPADPAADWPAIDPAERAYLAALGRGVAERVANVGTRWLALRSGDRVLPVTIDDGARSASYVCSPGAAYVDYAAREAELMGVSGGAALRLALKSAGRLLAAAKIDRIVHVDNWLLSTNLHADWDGRDLSAIRAFLAERFPDHLLAIRSVDDWSAPALAAAARDDGWAMVPSRQIWVVDDLARDWRARSAYGNDRRLVANSEVTIDSATPADAERIADLYRQLYIAKYSALNPVFTPRWVAETMASGLIEYGVAREAGGRAVAVAGLLVRGDVATPPVVGYDSSWPQSAGLYRIASWMFMRMATERGLRLHGSAGAAHFKRLRGAKGVVEYWAMDARHLSSPRRLTVATLAAGLERFVVPTMRRNGW